MSDPVVSSIDFANDLGCAHTRTALLSARSELVLARRLAHLAGPIDGVTTATRDQNLVHADAAYAAQIGFAGKLLIHPAQVAPALEGFSPTPEELEWAAAVLATGEDSGATSIDGAMVDLPVRLRAEQIRQRSEMFRRRSV